MEYKLVQSLGNPERFLSDVNSHLEKGWKLIGGVSTVVVDQGYEISVLYTQAMVKEKC